MNWPIIIQELLSAGWTQTALAKEIGWPQSSISAAAAGAPTNPSWTVGERLRKLHARTTRQAKRKKHAQRATSLA